MKFDILLTSNYLSIDKLSDNKRYRHEVILDLHGRGFTNKQISNHLNEQDILSSGEKEYYQNRIRAAIRKMKRREKRLKVSGYSVGDIRF